MTTNIHAFSSYIRSGLKVQVIRRNADGSEQILDERMELHRVGEHLIWRGADLLFREVEDPPTPTPHDDALGG